MTLPFSQAMAKLMGAKDAPVAVMPEHVNLQVRLRSFRQAHWNETCQECKRRVGNHTLREFAVCMGETLNGRTTE